MKKFSGLLAHAVLIAAQGVNQFGPCIPPKYQGTITIGLTFAQFLVATIQHNSDPATGKTL